MPAQIILAQDLPEPHAAVERIVANGLGHQHCQALAAAGGGRRPGFTMLVTQPNSATTADRCYNSSAKNYGSTPAPTWGHDVSGAGWQTVGRVMQATTTMMPVRQCGHSRRDRPVSASKRSR
jgi:hypothetical protein